MRVLLVTTPAERRELFLDAQEQTEEWNRAQRAEYLDAGTDDGYDPMAPDSADLAEMARWDRATERREREW